MCIKMQNKNKHSNEQIKNEIKETTLSAMNQKE